VDLAGNALAQQRDDVWNVRAAAALRADADDAVVAPRGRGHPAALADEQGHRLLDVDVLAGGARQHGVQGMPVVGSGDDHGLDVRVFEQPAEIRVAFGVGAALRLGVFDAWAIHVAHGRQGGVRELLKIGDVAQPDQAAADEADLHAVIGAQNAHVGGGGRDGQEGSA
jgi:hypothetical protein